MTVKHPVIFGEILYDIFDDGKRVLGGAPFNVAWHLHGFQTHPLMVTRIGTDANGEEIFRKMQQWGIDTLFVQRDAQHPTGTVFVSVEEGNPRFDIPADQAYDYIEASEAIQGLGDLPGTLLYHGTLALRQATSKEALEGLIHTSALPIFLDVNLRAPWWNKELVESSIKAAKWVKLNEDEIGLIEPEFATVNLDDQDSVDKVLERVCQRYELAMLIVTLGEKGALLKTPNEPFFKASTPKVSIVDTVGAGDGFSAVIIIGIMRQWPAKIMLERAIAFAALICQIRGATSNDPKLYQTAMAQWK
jgi:fructokinase